VTLLDREEALAACARIRAMHPDILDRLPDRLLRYQVAGPDERQVLYDFPACDRVAAASAAKKKARSADLDRLRRAGESNTALPPQPAVSRIA
jgi:hypothetical protein